MADRKILYYVKSYKVALTLPMINMYDYIFFKCINYFSFKTLIFNEGEIY